MSVRVTDLPNGLKVATDTMPTVESVSVGVYIGVGTRQERQRPIRPVHRQIDEHGAEFAFGKVDDRQQLVAICAKSK